MERRDYAAIWRPAGKIVYSRSLENVSSARTRIEREFEPDAVRHMKASAVRDISVGALTRRAGDQGRVGRRPPPVRDACRRGRGNLSLPDGVRLKLELLDERRFSNGVVHVQYRVTA